MLIFDIETGPLPEEQLKELYQEPTYEEFAANCDQRWKEETKREKFEAAKVEGWKRFVERAALSPVTGNVLAIGMRNDAGKSAILDCVDEPKALANFWGKYKKAHDANNTICGFNIAGFDVPFLVRRSWLLNVEIPATVFDASGRYLDRIFVDLMARWQCGRREDSIKLDALAKALGVGAKPNGVNGGDFHKLWKNDQPAATAYLLNDLDMTAKCAARMGVL